jgi:hypothetical protein
MAMNVTSRRPLLGVRSSRARQRLCFLFFTYFLLLLAVVGPRMMCPASRDAIDSVKNLGRQSRGNPLAFMILL